MYQVLLFKFRGLYMLHDKQGTAGDLASSAELFLKIPI